MKSRHLKVGDRVLIIGIPGQGRPNYYLHPDTRRVYKKLIKRNRPVRIKTIDEFGPWYECRFRRNNGTYEVHSLNIIDEDENWIGVDV